jgi:hypothetical protein
VVFLHIGEGGEGYEYEGEGGNVPGIQINGSQNSINLSFPKQFQVRAFLSPSPCSACANLAAPSLSREHIQVLNAAGLGGIFAGHQFLCSSGAD